MRVHMALVGRQTAPIYNCVMYFQPEKVHYIYSSETKRELSDLLAMTTVSHEAFVLDLLFCVFKIRELFVLFVRPEQYFGQLERFGRV